MTQSDLLIPNLHIGKNTPRLLKGKGNNALNLKNKDKFFKEMVSFSEKKMGQLTPQSQEELEQTLNCFILEAMTLKISLIYAKNMFVHFVNQMIFLNGKSRKNKDTEFVEMMKSEYEEKKIFFQAKLENSLDIPKAFSFIPDLNFEENAGLVYRLLDLFALHGNLKNWFDASLPQWKSLERRVLAEEVLTNKKYFLLDFYPKVMNLIENYDLRTKIIPSIESFWQEQDSLFNFLFNFPVKNRLSLLSSSCSKDTAQDILRMIKTVPLNKLQSSLREIDSLELFHEILINLISEQKSEKLKANKLEQKIRLETIEFEKYEVWVPENEFDLICMGKSLSNCVGGYVAKVSSGRSWVIGLKEDGLLKYCLEIEPMNGQILQFVSKFNKEASPSLWKKFDIFLSQNLC